MSWTWLSFLNFSFWGYIYRYLALFALRVFPCMHFYEYFYLDLFCRKLNMEQTCHYQGSKKIFQNEVKSLDIYEKFRWKIFCRKLNFKQTCHYHGSKETEFESNVSPPGVEKDLSNSVFGQYVEIYAFLWKISLGHFFLGNWILNKCNTASSRKKSFEFSFWWISRNLCIFMKIFARNFFCRKSNFEQTCHKQGSKKTFQIQFLFNKLKSMHFYENFR